MILGYARVSSPEQSIDLQVDALLAAGVPRDRIHRDTASGTRADRPGLARLVAAADKGDTIVVWRLDRLGRNMSHLTALAEELRGRGVTIRSITDGVDTGGTTGRLVLNLLGTLAEYEREILIERTRAGMEAARRRGSIMGRRPSLGSVQVIAARRMMAEGESAAATARFFRTSRASLYRAFARHPVPGC